MPTVRLFAAARDAAGTDHAEVQAESLPELSEVLSKTFGSEFARVLAVCSVLINGTRYTLNNTDVHLAADDVVDVLPPFAGG